MNTTQTAREALEELMRRCREDQHTPTYADLVALLDKFPKPAPPPLTLTWELTCGPQAARQVERRVRRLGRI